MFIVPKDPYVDVKVIVSPDPAIDWENTKSADWREYQRTKDLSLVKFKEGKEPSFFTLGSISYRLKNRIKDEAMSYSLSQFGGPEASSSVKISVNTMYTEAVRHSLKKWEGVCDEAGKPFELKLHEIGKVGKETYKTEVEDESLQILSNLGIINELGAHVIDINEISETERKNS